MKPAPVVHSTFVIERRYPVSSARLFAAFSDPEQRRRWFAEGGGHQLLEFSSDFRPGGASVVRYAMGADTPFPGVEIATEERFHDMVAEQRIISAQSMTFAGQHVSSALITIELEPAGEQTLMTFTHQGAYLEHSGGPEMRKDGWRVLFDRLDAALA